MADLNEPKKETVRISLPPPPSTPAENSGERRDTVRITLPPKPAKLGDAPSAAPVVPPKRPLPPAPAPSSGPVARPPMARAPMPAPSASAVRPPPYRSPAPPPPSAGSAAAPRPPAAPPVKPEGAATTLATPPTPPAPPVMPPRPKVLPPPPRVIPPARPPGSVSAAPSNYPGSGQAGPKKETARISILPEPAAAPAAVKMAKTQPLMAAPPPKVHNAPVSTVQPAPTVDKSTAWPSILDSLDAVPVPVAAVIFGISAVALLIQIWNYFGS